MWVIFLPVNALIITEITRISGNNGLSGIFYIYPFGWLVKLALKIGL
jgi:hypothetical protein